jgi:hypothetical protein
VVFFFRVVQQSSARRAEFQQLAELELALTSIQNLWNTFISKNIARHEESPA